VVSVLVEENKGEQRMQWQGYVLFMKYFSRKKNKVMTDYQTRAYAKQEVTDIAYILVTRFDKRKTSL
jgi:hypothetical protein